MNMHGDYTWDNTGLTNWSCVELNMAIICPSLSTLKPLLFCLFPRLFSTSSSRTVNGTQGNRIEGISGTRTRQGPGVRSSRPEVAELSDEESLRIPVSFELGQKG